ncbi:MAG: hypothetical protein ABUL55_01985 [Pseudomonadota bacterium]
MSNTHIINAIAFQQGDVWIIQGVELDIVARATNVADAPQAFLRAILQNAIISEELGKRPLEGIKPAPERFRRMFEEAKTALSPVDEATLPSLPIDRVKIRLAAEAA